MSRSDITSSFASIQPSVTEKTERLVTGKEWWFRFWKVSGKHPLFLSVLVVVMFRALWFLVGKITGIVDVTLFPETPPDALLMITLWLFVVLLLMSWSWLAEKVMDGMSRRNAFVQEVTVMGYAKISEARDSSTGEHLSRMARYAGVLAEALAKNPKYAGYITPQYVQDILVAAPLHDVGKVGTSDAILGKKGPLSVEEFELMKMHTIIGGDLMAELERQIPHTSFYTLGREIAYHHHQKWDGSGYPNVLNVGGELVFFVQPGVGKPLKGDEIPLSARIVALADVYDALRSKRCYKEPFTHETAKEMILQERGRHFDPDVVDAFLDAEKTFIEISNRSFRDKDGRVG